MVAPTVHTFQATRALEGSDVLKPATLSNVNLPKYYNLVFGPSRSLWKDWTAHHLACYFVLIYSVRSIHVHSPYEKTQLVPPRPSYSSEIPTALAWALQPRADVASLGDPKPPNTPDQPTMHTT